MKDIHTQVSQREQNWPADESLVLPESENRETIKLDIETGHFDKKK